MSSDVHTTALQLAVILQQVAHFKGHVLNQLHAEPFYHDLRRGCIDNQSS